MSICKQTTKKFCKEFENIENYQEAINSPEKYDCHHRLEDTGLSKKDLIDKGMYYNRPASELIFLTHWDHLSLHHKGKIVSDETRKKLSDAHRGKVASDETKKKISSALKGKIVSDETKKKISDARKGMVFSNETRKKLSAAHGGKYICPALLQMMYIEQRKSAYKISQEMGTSQKVILRRLRELNTPIRKR